ncbi:MAG: hypothetical protein AAGJ32_11090 [Pseudomonadota bacterium]
MTTIKQAAALFAKLAEGEAVDPALLKTASGILSEKLEALGSSETSLRQLKVSVTERRRRNTPVRTERRQEAKGNKGAKSSEGDAGATVAAKLALLERGGESEAAFNRAMADLLGDRAITAEVLRAIAEAYTGAPVARRATRSETERLLRQAYSRRQWQAEAYRRIDALNSEK